MIRAFTASCLLVGVLASSPVAAAELAGQASVIDGDTLEIHGQRIRLHGIDAPESSQTCTAADGKPWRCGQQAALALADHIGRGTVSCRPTDTDRYGRVVAVCSKSGEDLNAWLVAQGWAVAYRRYARDYVPREDEAKAARRGIWVGTFEMPWDWRQGRRGKVGGTPEAKNTCAIKGNINTKGERIYHLAGGRWYDKTAIDTAKGERWFCSETEARAAGWRRSSQ